jgi:hypothetical protein
MEQKPVPNYSTAPALATTPTHIPKGTNPYLNASNGTNATQTRITSSQNLFSQTANNTNPFKPCSLTNNSQSSSISGKLYSPKYIDDSLKPNDALSIELQPDVFKTRICDLGNIHLTLTKTIEKKKENLNLLVNNKKIPRSLRIKT